MVWECVELLLCVLLLIISYAACLFCTREGVAVCIPFPSPGSCDKVVLHQGITEHELRRLKTGIRHGQLYLRLHLRSMCTTVKKSCCSGAPCICKGSTPRRQLQRTNTTRQLPSSVLCRFSLTRGLKDHNVQWFRPQQH